MALSDGEAAAPPVVLITGCSDGGIGSALARAFAAAGCAVAATARSRASMRSLEADFPRPRLLLELDVRSDESVRRAVDAVEAELGGVDVLVNNAGVHLVAPLAEAPLDAVGKVFDTNVYGPLRLIQAVIPHMMKRRKGKIVNVGSVTALASGPWAGAYSASKAAVHAISDTLRLELRSFGIEVITVAPGAIRSNFGDSSIATYNQMPEWKYYKSFQEAMLERTKISQGPKAMPADEFARKIVAKVLRKNSPPWLSYGQFSTIFAILHVLPICIRDFIFRLFFKC